MMAFIQALGLRQPFLCGFSDGGIIGSLIAIRSAGLLRALVNHAGYDVFQPDNYLGYRKLLGGSEDATRTNPEHFQREFPEWVQKMQEEHDSVQGANYWKRLLSEIWPMWTQPMAHTLEDFRTIAIPTLISVGDHDFIRSVEEGVAVYRFLAQGELSVVPNLEHDFTTLAAQIVLDFLLRHRQHNETS
jgi:pimeloyl-ACP methyl ester carboxylesterase